jgi:hypothetical protein
MEGRQSFPRQFRRAWTPTEQKRRNSGIDHILGQLNSGNSVRCARALGPKCDRNAYSIRRDQVS